VDSDAELDGHRIKTTVAEGAYARSLIVFWPESATPRETCHSLLIDDRAKCRAGAAPIRIFRVKAP
jgi:hypothetical protein